MFAFLPAAPAVTLAPAPLQQVIAQVKFDSQAALSKHAGASAMHDHLGQQYPRLLSEPQTVVTAAPGGVNTSELPRWRIADLAGAWSCVISADSVAIETSSYSRWEELRGRLLAMFDALAEAASPRSRERVGLRYVNQIPAADDGSFQTRVQEQLLGVAAIDGWAPAVAVSLHQTVLREGDVQIAIRHGYGPGVIAPSNAFVLDIDCATEVPDLYDADATLELFDAFNDVAWRCFNALIHPEYRAGMETS